MSDIYQYTNYKDYLQEKIAQMPSKGRGIRLKLAGALNCQTAYISQVLNQHVHFSMEQVIKVNQFFHHNKPESKFFMLLVQYARAGSKELERYFAEEIEEAQAQRKLQQNSRAIAGDLDEVNQHIYYSSWYFSAVHMAIAIPNIQTPIAISQHLNLPEKIVHKVLDFLTETGLATQEKNKFKVGKTRIHLTRESLQAKRHHSNWREQSVQSLDEYKKDNFYYTNVISMGKGDVEIVSEILKEAIEDCRRVIRTSPEERLQILTIDFFNP